MKNIRHWRGAALAVLTVPAFASSPEIQSTVGSASVGVDLSSTDSRRVYAAGDYSFGGGWSVDAAIALADVDLPDASTRSTLAGVNLSYGFDRFTLGGGFRHSEIDGASRSDDWLVRGSWRYDTARIGLEVGHRASSLAPSPFTEDLGGELGVATGISRCDVDGIGYRGSVSLDRPAWSAFASLRVYDYDDFDCTLEITPVVGSPDDGPPEHARGRALGRRLAAAPLESIIGATSRLVPREASLLESSASIGFTTPVASNWIGGIELDRDVEKLDGSEYLTGIVSASTVLDHDWTVELSLGYSVADRVEDSVFAGVRVITYFRR
jgi:hypothetical protein